ncbi:MULTISPECIES: hypothetical protein [unclassified Pseudomonas]|uniref:hypothetical protein n=1 Tax=unclassified Pseudomonas TaxID=196821 RepID=UPI001F3A30D2|nr:MULTISPECIES: hypothetical protein [unclassified Pseudomonas]
MQPQNQTIDCLLAVKTHAFASATCLVVGASFALGAAAHQPVAAGLAYDAQTQSVVPIPPSERALQSIVADPWFSA